MKQKLGRRASRSVRRSRNVVVRQSIEALEKRFLLAAPTFETLSPQTIPLGKTLEMPLRGTDSDGDPITYSVTTDNSGVQPTIHTGNTWLKMHITGVTGDPSTPFNGDMLFQLFNDLAPHTAGYIADLAQSGFYNNLIFHRVLKANFVEGGSANGDGTGGPGYQYDDEISSATVYAGDAQLAMAHPARDANGSQFFITDGNQRAHFDYLFTLFGQLVRGHDVFDKLLNTDVSDNGHGEASKPLHAPVINSAQMVTDTQDGVLELRVSPTLVNSANITVTATDSHGEHSNQTFVVTGTADKLNGSPWLGPVPDLVTPANTVLRFDAQGNDDDGDALQYFGYFGIRTDAQGTRYPIETDSFGNRVETGANHFAFTPAANFTGKVQFTVYVQDSTNKFDTQLITVGVGDFAATMKSRSLDGVALADQPGMAVATFTDADPHRKASDWAVHASITKPSPTVPNTNIAVGGINWGDGVSSDGAVAQNADKSFSIYGSHAYAKPGTYSLSVTLDGSKGARAVAYSTITVRKVAELDKNGLLRVNGTSGNDTLAVSTSGSVVTATVNGKSLGYSGVTGIQVFALDGGDKVSIGSSVLGSYIDGGTGNDTLSGGDNKDTITGGAGSNKLFGNGGDDRLNGSGGRDSLDGGAGNDRLYGNAGNDTLVGGTGVDRLFGGDGDDLLVGNGSNDKLYGEAGNDTLVGGTGTDLLDGGPGTDTVIGKDAGESPVAVEVLL